MAGNIDYSKPVEQRVSPQRSREILTSYLNVEAPHLVQCIPQVIDGHYRFIEAIAISGQETSFCRNGVARTKNNCGGIMSLLTGQPNGRFASYASKCDGLEQIANLIERGRYANWTIEEMNGTYCMNETSGVGGKCPNWTENIMATVNSIRSLY